MHDVLAQPSSSEDLRSMAVLQAHKHACCFMMLCIEFSLVSGLAPPVDRTAADASAAHGTSSGLSLGTRRRISHVLVARLGQKGLREIVHPDGLASARRHIICQFKSYHCSPRLHVGFRPLLFGLKDAPEIV